MRTEGFNVAKSGEDRARIDVSAKADPQQSINKSSHGSGESIRKIYDNHDASRGKDALSVKIVRNFEDMATSVAIRASAYFTDEEHLYAKHFDGNDFSATHLIGYVGSEPVATLRIRYFAEFVRIERLAVRPTHRRSRIAFQIVRAAFAFCRDKGYRRISGVAREEMVPFWSLFGGSVSRSADPIFIYGLPHYEMFVEFPGSEGAVTAASPPLVLLRPEGRWHEAGYHETQGARPAAAPARTTPAEIARRLSGRGAMAAEIAPRPEERTTRHPC